MNHWFNKTKKKFENKRKRDEAKEIIDLKGNWEEKEEDDDICVCVFPSSSYIKRRQGGDLTLLSSRHNVPQLWRVINLGILVYLRKE